MNGINTGLYPNSKPVYVAHRMCPVCGGQYDCYQCIMLITVRNRFHTYWFYTRWGAIKSRKLCHEASE